MVNNDEKKEIWLDYYTGEDCINCGRNRVEQSNKGRRVCEKCYMDQDTGEYAIDYMRKRR